MCLKKEHNIWLRFLGNILLIVVFIIPVLALSQDINRKGKFYFNIGPEYRITPAYKFSDYSKVASYTNRDRQNSGLALNIGVNYYITKRLSVGYRNSFRYDLITTETATIGGAMTDGVSATKNDLIVGYHFNVNYHFPLFKKGDLLANFGLAFLNRNTEFSFTESVVDGNGEVIGSVKSLANYNYNTNKISVGYMRGGSRIMLGTYFTSSTNYFEEKNMFLVPFINYSFDFGKL